jgi:hypothetical protein
MIAAAGAQAQCNVHVYNFTEGKEIRSATEHGLIRTSEDFLKDNVEKADRMEIQYDGLQIRYDKKSSKFKYDALFDEYWGFSYYNHYYRFRAYESNGKTTITSVDLCCMGKLCLYGSITPDEPKKTENGYTYSYCYNNDVSSFISLGLNGPVIYLSNENFSNLLGEIDAKLKEDYLNEFAGLKGAKLQKSPTENKATMTLFTKYFELANNSSER